MTQGNFLDVKESDVELSQKVIELIRNRREELGIGQIMLSKLSGVDQAYISRIERGIRPNCSFGMIAKLFTALNIKFAEIDEL